MPSKSYGSGKQLSNVLGGVPGLVQILNDALQALIWLQAQNGRPLRDGLQRVRYACRRQCLHERLQTMVWTVTQYRGMSCNNLQADHCPKFECTERLSRRGGMQICEVACWNTRHTPASGCRTHKREYKTVSTQNTGESTLPLPQVLNDKTHMCIRHRILCIHMRALVPLRFVSATAPVRRRTPKLDECLPQ